MGARPLRRAVQSFIEDPLAEEILSGCASQGDVVSVGVKNGKAVFSVKLIQQNGGNEDGGRK